MADVEVAINTFERNIDMVMAPGFLTRAFEQHQFPFAVRTLLVNNVDNRSEAAHRAESALNRGEIDRFMFVDELLPRGLAATHLRRRDFGRFLHWSDCCLSALAAPGPDLLCYVDVDLTLQAPADWITPGLHIMGSDSRVAVANPVWVMPDGTTSVEDEADECTGFGWLGYGFTDQVFLVRRSDFARPLRRRPRLPIWLESPASLRYPGPSGNLFFEQIADAYMRRERLMRATISLAQFTPVPLNTYPARGLIERARGRRDRVILRSLERVAQRRPGLLSDPRVRTTGLLDPRAAGAAREDRAPGPDGPGG